MGDLTIGHEEIEGGYLIRRGDGKLFILRWGERGEAILYAGGDPNNLPVYGLAHFDLSQDDKLAASRRYILAWPERPPEIL